MDGSVGIYELDHVLAGPGSCLTGSRTLSAHNAWFSKGLGAHFRLGLGLCEGVEINSPVYSDDICAMYKTRPGTYRDGVYSA